MKWTSTKPTQPGAFFYQLAGKGLRLAMVFKKDGELHVHLTGTYMEYPISALSGLWAGPISEPVYAGEDQ